MKLERVLEVVSSGRVIAGISILWTLSLAAIYRQVCSGSTWIRPWLEPFRHVAPIISVNTFGVTTLAACGWLFAWLFTMRRPSNRMDEAEMHQTHEVGQNSFECARWSSRALLASMMVFMPLPIFVDSGLFFGTFLMVAANLFLHLFETRVEFAASCAQVLFYAVTLHLLAKRAVDLTIRCRPLLIRRTLLVLIIALPVVAGCLTGLVAWFSVTVFHIRNNGWLAYSHLWHNYDSDIRSLVTAFTAGLIATHWWLFRRLSRPAEVFPKRRTIFLSENAATQVTWVIMAMFLPIYLLMGLGESVSPYPLLLLGVVGYGDDNILRLLFLLGHAVIYSYLIFLAARWSVRLVYRIPQPLLRALALLAVLCIPVVIASRPIFFDSGIRGNYPPPTDAWHYYRRSWGYESRMLPGILGAFCAGMIGRFWLSSSKERRAGDGARLGAVSGHSS